MKTELKIAVIGGLFAIIVAIVTGFFGLLGSKSQPAPSASATSGGRVIQMNGQNSTYIHGNQVNEVRK